MKFRGTITAALAGLCVAYSARAYVVATTVPAAGGCPDPDRWNASASLPVSIQWSTVLPPSNVLMTAAPAGTSAQITEIQNAIAESLGAWTGVTGTTLNATTYPGAVGPLGTTTVQNACLNDQESNADGLNTICFDQASSAFTTGVLTFTRTIVANAPGAAVGSSTPSIFAGQILRAGILVRNDGQASFATPSALAISEGQGAYDLKSILIHELGHLFWLEESGIWRAAMFPFAAAPGTFVGNRPTAQVPDGPLADDDRTGLRVLYPDPADTVNVGAIRGRILPANPFALAIALPTAAGQFVTGMPGTQVVAVDSTTGAVFAGTLGGWSCDSANQIVNFDGSFQIERLPVGRSYRIYAKPFDGLASSSTAQTSIDDACRAGNNPICTPAAPNTNFTARIKP